MNLTKEKQAEIADGIVEKIRAKQAEESRKPIHADAPSKAKIKDLKNRIMLATLPEYVRELASESDNFEKTREFLRALKDQGQNNHEPMMRLQKELRAMSEGTAGSGGYLVPEEFAQLVITKKSAIAKMRKYATVIPTVRDSLHVPYDNANASVSWEAENSTPTPSNPTFSEAALTPYKLKVLSVTSNELLADANIQVINYLADQFARLMAAEEDKQFFTGNGSSKPTGVRTMTPDQTVAQAGATLAYSDILDCFMNLPEQYRNVAQWFTSPTGVQLIMGLVDSNGRPIFMPSYEVGKPGMLFGRPLLEVADFPTNLGTHSNTTELWIGDLSTYVIADRQDFQLAVSTERYFENDQTAIKATQRVDGEYTLTAAFSALTGVK